MWASINGNHCTKNVSCYSPTNASDEANSTTFNEQSWFVPKHKDLFISGYVNAQIGNYENYKFCLHNLLNVNSEYLADFSLENSHASLKTKF